MAKLVTVTFFLYTINVSGLTSSSATTSSSFAIADSAINGASEYTSVDFVHQKSTTHGNSSKSSDITSYSLPSMLTPANRTKSDRVTVAPSSSSSSSSSSSFLAATYATQAGTRTIASQSQPPVTHKDLSKARSHSDQREDLLREEEKGKNVTLTQSPGEKYNNYHPSPLNPPFGLNPLKDISIVTSTTHVLNGTSIEQSKNTTTIANTSYSQAKEEEEEGKTLSSPVTAFNVTRRGTQHHQSLAGTSLSLPFAVDGKDDSLLSGTIKHEPLNVTIKAAAAAGTTSASVASSTGTSKIKSDAGKGETGKSLHSGAAGVTSFSHLDHLLSLSQSPFNSSHLAESPKHTVKARKGVKEYPSDEAKLQVKERSQVDPLLHQYLLSGLIKSEQEKSNLHLATVLYASRPPLVLSTPEKSLADTSNDRNQGSDFHAARTTGHGHKDEDEDSDADADVDGGKGIHSHENWHHVNQNADADERRQNSSLHFPSPSRLHPAQSASSSSPSPSSFFSSSSSPSASSDHERPFAADTKSGKKIFPFASFSAVILTTGNRSTHTSNSLADANITHVSSRFFFYPPSPTKLTNHSTEKHFSTPDQTARKNFSSFTHASSTLTSASASTSTFTSIATSTVSLSINSSETAETFTSTRSSSAQAATSAPGTSNVDGKYLQLDEESLAQPKSQVELNSIPKQNDASPSLHSQSKHLHPFSNPFSPSLCQLHLTFQFFTHHSPHFSFPLSN